MMRVYRLCFESDASVVLESRLEYFQSHFVGVPLGNDWKPPDIRIAQKKKPLRDFTSWMLGAPVLTQRARECLESLIRPHAEFLPLMRIRGQGLFALNVVRLLDCLDRNEARVVMSPSEPGRIVNVMRFAFETSKLPEDAVIFKVPQDTGHVFVSQTFVDVVVRERLTGVLFVEPTASLFAPIFPANPQVVKPV